MSNHVEITARALVSKLDEIADNLSYQGVWAFLSTHGYRYEGPSYAKELIALRTALSATSAKAIDGPHAEDR